MAASQQLLEALNVLYYNEDPQLKERANAWLDAWQQTQEAWSISDSVLHDASASLEAQYFCAQTLRTKVQRDFEELPNAAVVSLRDSLLTLLIKFSKGAPPVRTQLCLALAAMAVMVPAARWDDTPAPAGGGDVVRWFALRFQAAPSDRALPCMLEILTVLPQEAYSNKIAVRLERRKQFREELTASTPTALDVLRSCLAQPEECVRQQVLEALGAWLRLSEGKPLLADGFNQSQPLVAATLDGLSSPETFHSAVDAVCELIWATIDTSTQQQHPSMLPVIQSIVPAVMGLRPRFAVASRRLAATLTHATPGARVDPAAAAANGANDETDDFDDDGEMAKGMARLFCELSEAYLSLIATAVPEVQAPVEAMLEVAAFPDFTVCSMSFNFWGRLANVLVRACVPPPPQKAGVAPTPSTERGSTVPPTEALRRRAAFAPTFERLVALLQARTRYPNDHEALWGREERAEFKHIRHQVSDALEDCAGMLGYRGMLGLLAQPLSAAVAAAGANGSAGGIAWDWRTAESSLYCVRAIAKRGAELGLQELQMLMSALPGLTTAEPRLLYTACSLIAAYAPWLGSSLQIGLCQELLPDLLRLVISGLCRTDAAGAAAVALVAICDRCGCGTSGAAPPLQASLDMLSTLYGRAMLAGVVEGANPAQAPGLAITEEDVLMIIQAVCVATTRSLSLERLRPAAVQLLQPVLTAVQAAVAALPAVPPTPVPGTSGSHGSTQLAHQFPMVSPLLDRLTVIFDYISDEVTAAEILGQSWPVLCTVLSRCGSDARLVEHACRALRHAIKAAGKLAAPVVPLLLQVLPGKYRETHQSVFLYVTGELAKLFGDDPQHGPALAPVLCTLLAEACGELHSLADLTQHPDLVDDVFLCAARAVKYCPQLLLPNQLVVETLMNTAMLGVLTQHHEACTSSIGFVVAIYDPEVLRRIPPASTSTLQGILGHRSPTLMRLLLAGVCGSLPKMRLPDLAAAIAAMIRSAPAPAYQWFGDALQLLPDVAVTQLDKAQLMRSNTYKDVDAFKTAIDDFSEVCRRHRRASTAAQRALLPAELQESVLRENSLLPP